MSRVTFEGRRYPLREGESVLSALLRGGAEVPFSCRRGTCHACCLRAIEGAPDADGQRGVRETLQARGYFLPCQSHPREDLVVTRPDPHELSFRVHLVERCMLAPHVAFLRFEPEVSLSWRSGQYLNLQHPSGQTRSYSIASVPDGSMRIDLHVEVSGLVSRWLAHDLDVGDALEASGPFGSCTWDPAHGDRPHLLIATGTGLAPLLPIAREAIAHGTRVALYHGARTAEGLYLHDELSELGYIPCISSVGRRAVDLAFDDHPELAGHRVFVAGRPEVVESARRRAIAQGVARDHLLTDSFEDARPFVPDDDAKLKSLAPDPELWNALDRGPLLTTILRDFYGRVYQDERLAPFFHKVTRERAIEKQYAFLADVISGSKAYFGLKPFNAHHWMIISDELFDYRERLFEECLRRHDLEERFVRRILSIHETFRRELVKSSPRGLIVDGVERRLEGWSEEELSIGCVCDGCGDEMPAGSRGRVHQRTGELFCQGCAARRVGATQRPEGP